MSVKTYKQCQAKRPLICSECAKNEPNDVRLALIHT